MSDAGGRTCELSLFCLEVADEHSDIRFVGDGSRSTQTVAKQRPWAVQGPHSASGLCDGLHALTITVTTAPTVDANPALPVIRNVP